jgi:hypothetical protein
MLATLISAYETVFKKLIMYNTMSKDNNIIKYCIVRVFL